MPVFLINLHYAVRNNVGRVALGDVFRDPSARSQGTGGPPRLARVSGLLESHGFLVDPAREILVFSVAETGHLSQAAGREEGGVVFPGRLD